MKTSSSNSSELVLSDFIEDLSAQAAPSSPSPILITPTYDPFKTPEDEVWVSTSTPSLETTKVDEMVDETEGIDFDSLIGDDVNNNNQKVDENHEMEGIDFDTLICDDDDIIFIRGRDDYYLALYAQNLENEIALNDDVEEFKTTSTTSMAAAAPTLQDLILHEEHQGNHVNNNNQEPPNANANRSEERRVGKECRL